MPMPDMNYLWKRIATAIRVTAYRNGESTEVPSSREYFNQTFVDGSGREFLAPNLPILALDGRYRRFNRQGWPAVGDA